VFYEQVLDFPRKRKSAQTLRISSPEKLHRRFNEKNKGDFKSEKKSYFTRDLAEKDKAPEKGAVWPEDFSCSEKRGRLRKKEARK